MGQRTHKENEGEEGELKLWAKPLNTKHPNGSVINPLQRHFKETRRVATTREKTTREIVGVRSWTNTPVVLKSLFEKKVMGQGACERVRMNMCAFAMYKHPGGS